MDGTIPRKALPEVLTGMSKLAAHHGLRVANVFHAGDGNLHPLILYDANKPGEMDKAEAFGADILRLCVEVGGVLTGEHGVGIEKRDLMPEMFSEVDLNQQQRIKCAFDSQGLLNPGKVFPTLHRCAELGRVHLDASVDILKVRDAQDVEQAVRASIASEQPLEIIGHGSKRMVGQPVATNAVLDLSALNAVTSYEPNELILTVQAGAPIADVLSLIDSKNQQFSFEPMNTSQLLGTPDIGTIGGMISAGLAGPRRIQAGGARDHLLGVHAVSGFGD
eukprot:gene14030-18572_t